MNAYDVTVTAMGTATVTIPLCASGYDSEVFYATKDIDFGEFSIRKRETIGIEEKETYALASVRITGAGIHQEPACPGHGERKSEDTLQGGRGWHRHGHIPKTERRGQEDLLQARQHP